MKPLDGPSGPEADFTDLHAWAEVYLPGAGWVGPRPDLGAARRRGPHPAGLHRRPAHRRPVTGSFAWTKDPAQRRRRVRGRVRLPHGGARGSTRIPRVTKPYTEEQWRAIDALGHAIDARPPRGGRAADDGRRADVRLDRRHGRRRVEHRRPGRRQAASSPASCSSGSATGSPPGRCSTTARASGIPASRCRAGRSAATGGATACRLGRPRLIADETRDYGHTDGRRPALRRRPWPTAWASIPRAPSPAYEDAWYYLWREQRLPVNVDPLEEQARRPGGAAAAGPGLRAAASDQVVGYALPLQAGSATGRATAAVGERPAGSSAAEHLFLFPGDSPMGFRLPLDSLPWADPRTRRRSVELDPFAPRAPLPPRDPIAATGGRQRSCRAAATGTRPARTGGRRRSATDCAGRRRASRASSARRSASSRATAGSTSSCRPSGYLEDYLDLVARRRGDGRGARDCRCHRGLPAARRSTG